MVGKHAAGAISIVEVIVPIVGEKIKSKINEPGICKRRRLSMAA
jgi:hypothetical protein